MVKKCFVYSKEVIDVLHEIFYIPTIGKLSFHLDHVRILGSMECGNAKKYFPHVNALRRFIKLKKDYGVIFIEIQSQHWGGNRQLSMEGIAVEYFTN